MRHTYYKMIDGNEKSARMTRARAMADGWWPWPMQARRASEGFAVALDLARAFSRDELRKVAAELDIPGRSTMNKEQLVEAVARKRCGRQ